MSGDLPDWYPLADATDKQIEPWLAVDTSPYQEMHDALPWLDHDYELNAWIASVRDLRKRTNDGEWVKTFPGIASMPLPPRRLAGRHVQ